MKRYTIGLITLLLIVGCGKKDGVHTEYYDYAKKLKKSEITYKDGKLDGLYTDWYENGNKKGEGTYKDGKYDEWGNPKRVGLYTDWYENGNKYLERTYKDGKIDGLFTTWYENGNKKGEGTYKDGKIDGLFTSWYENGKLNEKIMYENDFASKSAVRNRRSGDSDLTGGKECLCCGKKFSHSGYRLGYGKDAFGVNSKIGVQPGAYDSEACAFACEHMNGLLK